MALSLLTPIPATCYTSQLQKISLSTSAETLQLTITHQAANYYSGNGQSRVFQTTYSARLNRVTIYDIGSLLETFMLERDGLQQFIFDFRVGTDTLSQTYTVIYCKHLPDITADVMWPAVVNAYSYEFTITDSNGNTVCTLTFNANGQLTGLILHAPAAEGVMQHAAAGTGFSFNVTGLQNGNSYSLVIKAKDSNGVVLQTFSQDFTTGATALENVSADGTSGVRKVIEDGKVVIIMPDGRKFDASGKFLK